MDKRSVNYADIFNLGHEKSCKCADKTIISLTLKNESVPVI